MLKSDKQNKQYYKKKNVLDFKREELYKTSLNLFGKNELTTDLIILGTSLFFIFNLIFIITFQPLLLNFKYFFIPCLSSFIGFIVTIIFEILIFKENRNYLLNIIAYYGFKNNFEENEMLKKLDYLKYIFLFFSIFMFFISILTFFII